MGKIYRCLPTERHGGEEGDHGGTPPRLERLDSDSTPGYSPLNPNPKLLTLEVNFAFEAQPRVYSTESGRGLQSFKEAYMPDKF